MAEIGGIQFRIIGNDSGASRSLDRLADSMRRVKTASSGMSNVAGTIRKISGSLLKLSVTPLKSLARPFKEGISSVTHFASKLGEVASGFKRILGYRLIRLLIKEIGQAFREGVQHVYDWSRAMREAGSGDLGRFANSMDDIATSLAYLKNSIGAAAAPLVNMLAPAIDTVTNAVIALLNAINQLLARLTGQSSWTRATRHAEEYGDAVGGAGGAAKEALKYLAPFDELNVLPSQRSGGGGGGLDDDVGGLFEEMVEFEEGISNFADRIRAAIDAENWKELGTILGDKVNEIVDSIDWAGIGTSIGKKINAWFTTKYWTLETINFTNIGAKIAEFLNNAIGNIDFEVIGASLVQKFTILGNLIIGAVENIDWTKVGESIGSFVRGAFNQASSWLEGLNFYDLGYGLVTKLSNLFAGIDFSSTVQSVKRAITDAFKAAGNFLDGVFDGLEDQLGVDLTLGISDLLFEDKTDWTAKDWIDHIAQAIAPIAGTVIGALVGGGPGAMFGGTIGIALSLLIQSIGDPKDESGWTAAKWQGSITSVLLAVGGAAVGLYFAPGLKGALLGASIGIGLSLAIKTIGDLIDESGWDATKWQGAIYTVLFAAGGAAIGLHLGGLKGALLGAAVGVGLSVYLKGIDENIRDDSGWSLDSWLLALKNVIGTVTGATLGFKVGGPGGAAFGMLLGLGIDVALNYISKEMEAKDGLPTGEDWAKAIIAAMSPFAGAAIGFAVGGPGGALIGATIGISISWFITHVDPIDEFGDAEFWIERYGADLPTINIPVNAAFDINDNFDVDSAYNWIKERLDNYDFRYAEDLLIKVPVGVEPNVPDDLKDRLTKIVSDNEWDLYVPVDLLPDGWETPAEWVRQQQTESDVVEQPVGLVESNWSASGGGAYSSDFYGHFRTNTVSYWVASHGGKELLQPVSLGQEKWSTVSDWVYQYGGGDVNKPIGLTRTTAWQTVADWLNGTGRSGGVVLKPITLAKKKEQWQTIAGWLNETGRSGGVVNKPVGLGKTGWSTLETWLKKGDQYGGPVDKKVTLSTVMSTLAATLATMAFVVVWNSLGDKTITLTVEMNNKVQNQINSIKGAWNTLVGAWNRTPILANKASLWYLASGGIVNNSGQIFVARESGPELVGSYGSKSAVMNNDQIVRSVSDGVAKAISNIHFAVAGMPSAYSDEYGMDEDAVYRAMVRALTDTGGGETEIDVNLDGDVLYRHMVRRNRANTRMTGVNAMA